MDDRGVPGKLQTGAETTTTTIKFPIEIKCKIFTNIYYYYYIGIMGIPPPTHIHRESGWWLHPPPAPLD